MEHEEVEHGDAPQGDLLWLGLTSQACSTDPASARLGGSLKPVEARARLGDIIEILTAGQPLPPVLRVWLVDALRTRVTHSDVHLDNLLGLRSRDGGRLHAFSKNPARDRAILQLVPPESAVDQRVALLVERIEAHRTSPDPVVARVEAEHGRIPGSRSQLHRILSGKTAASQMVA